MIDYCNKNMKVNTFNVCLCLYTFGEYKWRKGMYYYAQRQNPKLWFYFKIYNRIKKRRHAQTFEPQCGNGGFFFTQSTCQLLPVWFIHM